MTDLDWIKQENIVAASVQGSEAWLNERKKGIGSSDIAVIMGVARWGSLYNLWLDKTGQLPEDQKFKGNWATERGTRLEPEARSLYEAKVGSPFSPAVAVHPEYSFARSSFDGINHELRKVIEIKCPGREAHESAKAGKVPEYYWPQVQWLLMIAGYDDLDYISWDGETDPVIVPVKADKAYHETMLAKAREFWTLVESRTPPPLDELQIEDQELEAILMERQGIKDQIDALTERFDALTDQVKARVPESAQCGLFKITWSEMKGSIDYAKIPELKGLDLEPYRKTPTKRFQISLKSGPNTTP